MTKILAIDDKQDNLITLSAILKNLIPECRVITAQSGPEGLEMAKIHAPDMILLDSKMPGMDGYEVCRKLKEDENTRPIPVILISAVRKESKDLVKGLDSGADAYLTKPIDELVLAAQIKTALRLKAAEDYLRMQKGLLEDMVQIRTAELVQKSKQLSHEINERKWVEEKLKDSGDFLKTLIDAIPTPVFYKDRVGKYLGFNRAFETFFGETKERLIGKSVFDINPPELAEIYHAQDDALFNSGGVQIYESQVRNAYGKLHDVIFNKAVFTDSKGAVIGLIGTITNVTERKQAEEALRETEKRRKIILKTAMNGFWVVDLDGRLIEVNEAYCRMSGYSEQELLSMSILDLEASETPEEIASHIQKIIAEGTVRFERKHRRKDGSLFDIELSVQHTPELGGQLFAFLRDISEHKQAEKEKAKLEAQLQQAQKMEAIGTLAGGIAHDFNNILMPLIIYTESALQDIPEESPIKFNLEKVFNAAIRAKDLVRQILTFSRRSGEERVPLKISPIIEEAMKLLRSSLPTTIEIRQSIDPESGVILADPTQIHQVLMNLCTNASHAMRKGGGVLKVSLGTVDIGVDDKRLFPDLSPGSYVKMTVADTGHGMERSIKEQIFDPYFTTKGKGEGTGLGLAVVHGIIKSHGGKITVESKPGKGTTFDVLLPMIEGVEKLETKVIEPLPRGKERILFIDDEKSMVEAVKLMLERLGYKVTSKMSSIEALEAFRENPQGFDLVITDYTMPNMTGAGLAREFMNIRPDIPIILCTGFSDMINKEKAEAMGIKAFVIKPVVRRELAKIIRDVLDENEALG